jgi:mannose-6-phosphate isomerase-like protein (cupin superfamily)
VSEAGTEVQYVRPANFEAAKPDEMYRAALAGRDSGVQNSMVAAFRIPAGMGWRPDLHIHDTLEQCYYVISGTLSLEISGADYKVPAGCLAYIPAGAPHRNWNEGPGEVMYLEINAGQFGAGAGRPPGAPSS